jgi:hypothetical protein
MKLVEVEATAWDQLSGADVRRRLEHEPHLVDQPMRPLGSFPKTYLFQTRDGGVGVLQLLRFDQARIGAVIRYKRFASR